MLESSITFDLNANFGTQIRSTNQSSLTAEVKGNYVVYLKC